MEKKLPIQIIFILIFIFSSCLTNDQKFRDFTEAPLLGMVYDHDNEPCSGALIIMDEEQGPLTDINGRFIIASLTRGTHQVQVIKEGYEELTVSFDFLNKSQVLYLKVTSFNQLLRKIELALEKKRLKEAEELIARAEAVYSDDPVEMYLKAVYLLEIERAEEAVKILAGIIEKGFKEPIVYLTLADIFQYRLEDLEQAVIYLEEYLKVQREPEARKRLEELSKSRAVEEGR